MYIYIIYCGYRFTYKQESKEKKNIYVHLIVGSVPRLHKRQRFSHAISSAIYKTQRKYLYIYI